MIVSNSGRAPGPCRRSVTLSALAVVLSLSLLGLLLKDLLPDIMAASSDGKGRGLAWLPQFSGGVRRGRPKKEKLVIATDIELARESVEDGTIWLPIDLLRVESSNVLVKMCLIDYGAYFSEPWTYPMYETLKQHSCKERNNVVTLPLDTMLKKMELQGQGYIEPSGFVFHETRCGSTLVANSLASVHANRVLSEARPMTVHLRKILIDGKAPPGMESKLQYLAQSMFHLMGRRREGEVHSSMYFKFQNSLFSPYLTDLYPRVPWLYIFRDPVEVMQSLIGNGDSRSPCTRFGYKPKKGPHNLGIFSLPVQRESPEYGEMADICAQWLIELDKAAMESYEAHPDTGLMVAYSELPSVFIDYIYEHHFHGFLDTAWQDHMLKTSGHYSKSFASKKDKELVNDSQSKHEKANPAILAASERMYDTFNKLSDMPKPWKG